MKGHYAFYRRRIDPCTFDLWKNCLCISALILGCITITVVSSSNENCISVKDEIFHGCCVAHPIDWYADTCEELGGEDNGWQSCGAGGQRICKRTYGTINALEEGATIMCSSIENSVYRCTNGKRRHYTSRLMADQWDPDWETIKQTVDCAKIVEGDPMFYTCGPLEMGRFSIPDYTTNNQDLWSSKDLSKFELGTKITFRCEHDSFFYPVKREIECQMHTAGPRWEYSGPFCKCGRCPNLQETDQTRNEMVSIVYRQIPPKQGISCNEAEHPIDTVARISCTAFPWLRPTKTSYKCQSDHTWSNQHDVKDYCKCAVQCSNFCLGVGDQYKTSITGVQFEWKASEETKITWEDGCHDTNDGTYKVKLFRSYSSEYNEDWSSSYEVADVKKGTTHFEDKSMRLDSTEKEYVPGLRIKYRWKQYIKIQEGGSLLEFSPANDECDGQTIGVTSLPFFFDFSYVLTSPDGRVDIAGATLKITNVANGDIIFQTNTVKRSIDSSKKKADPDVHTVKIIDVTYSSLHVKVTMEYQSHAIVCDYPLCNTKQDYWEGNIEHLETIQFSFTDLTTVSISGTLKASGTDCPVKNVGFTVTSIDAPSISKVETFSTATNTKGEYSISAQQGLYRIEPFYEDHTFQYQGTNNFAILIDGNMNSLNFVDVTTRDLTVRLVGGANGCDAGIGEGYIKVQGPHSCYDEYFEISSESKTHIIPALNLNLLVDAFSTNKKYQWVWDNGKVFSNFEEYMIASNQYNNLGVHEVSAVNNNYVVTFRYHPVVTKDDIDVNVIGVTNIMDTLNREKKPCTGIYTEFPYGNETDSCGSIESDDHGNLWTFEQKSKGIKTQFTVKETYGGKICYPPGKIHISEDWSSLNGDFINAEPDLNDQNGIALYTMNEVGRPEFGCPFTKELLYKIVVEDNDIQKNIDQSNDNFILSFTSKTIVTGTVENNNNSLHQTSPKATVPLMILRDPPGANSYTSIAQSTEISLTTSAAIEYGGGSNNEGAVQFGTEFMAGIGFGVTTKLVGGIKGEFEVTESQSSNTQYSIMARTTQTFTSSTDPALTGKYGDVLLGIGITTTIRPSYTLKWNETLCLVASTKTIAYKVNVESGEDGNLALYSYTHWFVENVVIPEAKLIERNPNSSEEDKIKAKKTHEDWQKILDEKELVQGIDQLGENGTFFRTMDEFIKKSDNLVKDVQNGSLGGFVAASAIAAGAATMAGLVTSLNVPGAAKFGVELAIVGLVSSSRFGNSTFPEFKNEYSKFVTEYTKFKYFSIAATAEESPTKFTIDGGHSFSTSTSISMDNSHVIEHTFDLDTQWGSWAKNDVGGIGGESVSAIKASFTFNTAVTNSEQGTLQFEYTIHDPDIGDEYLIDIKEDQSFGSPIFDVKSGRSLCRHEENTVAREGVEIKVVRPTNTQRTDLLPHENAIFVVALRHTGYDTVYPRYNIRQQRAELKGKTGLITLAGIPLGNHIQFTNLVKDQWVEFELVVWRSYTEYSFSDLTLEAYSPCEDIFYTNAMPVPIISDTVSVSANWLQPCAEAQIDPEVDFLSVKASTIIPYRVKIINPSHQGMPWYIINNLEMRVVWKVWTPDNSALPSYVKLNGSNIVKKQSDFEKELSQTTYINWDLSSMNDGKYTLQVETKCPNQAPEYTEPKLVYIQRTELQVAGRPQPADGEEYVFGTDIMVRFNRKLNCFNPNMRIRVIPEDNINNEIDMHLVCKDNTILAMPTVRVDLHYFTDKLLRITFLNIMDFAGNYLNSNDGASSFNGITWVVQAKMPENINILPARLSLCIMENVIIDGSNQQLLAAKTAFKKKVHETFDYLGGIPTCRLLISDPYYFDATCKNNGKRWDLIVLPSNYVSEECNQEIASSFTPSLPIETSSKASLLIDPEVNSVPIFPVQLLPPSLSPTFSATSLSIHSSAPTISLKIDSQAPGNKKNRHLFYLIDSSFEDPIVRKMTNDLTPIQLVENFGAMITSKNLQLPYIDLEEVIGVSLTSNKLEDFIQSLTISPCKDSSLRFMVQKEDKDIPMYCTFVGRYNTEITNERCSLQGVNITCPHTCGTCAIMADSPLKIRFSFKNKIFEKSCGWVRKKNKIERCNIPGISGSCRRTCKSGKSKVRKKGQSVEKQPKIRKR